MGTARTVAEASVGDTLAAAHHPRRPRHARAVRRRVRDRNPIHWDERFATSVGLPDVIAHGMFTMGAAVTVVTDWVGDAGRVRRVRHPLHQAGRRALRGRRRRSRSAASSRRRRRDAARHGRAHRDVRRRQGARPRRRRRRPRLTRPHPCARSTTSPLASLTTMRVGGPAAAARDRRDHRRAGRRGPRGRRRRRAAAAVSAAAPTSSSPTRASPGSVVRVATSGVTVESADGCGGAHGPGRRRRGLGRPRRARGRARAGRASRRCPASPGRTGATPIQNVGAYGQEVSQTIAQVRVWDRREQEVRTFANADCGFTYRHSALQGRAAGTSCSTSLFQLRPGDLSAPVGVRRPGPRARASTRVRGCRWTTPGEAVLAQRRQRGMVLDADDHDTWSVRLVLHQPDPVRRSASRRCGTGPRAARARGAGAAAVRRAGRPGQDQRRVADRQGRLRQGLRPARPGGPVDQAHPRPDQPGRRHGRRRRSPWPARSATACRTRSGSPWSTSRSWSAPRSDAPGPCAGRRARTPRRTLRRVRPRWVTPARRRCPSSRRLAQRLRGPRRPHRPAGQGRQLVVAEAPAPSAPSSYCAASRDPNSSGSSAPRATWAPALDAVGAPGRRPRSA